MNCHDCKKRIDNKTYKEYWGLCKECQGKEDRICWTSATVLGLKEFTTLAPTSTIAVFDTECTGLPPRTFYLNAFRHISDIPRILTVGMVKYKEGAPEEKRYWIVKPDGYKNSPEAEKVNKLTPEILEQGEPLIKVITEILDFLKDVDILCAHNVSYDYTVLASELYRLSLRDELAEFFSKKFFNTQVGYRVSLTNMYRLIMEKDPEGDLHNALADAEICAAVAKNLAQVNYEGKGEACQNCGKGYPAWWFGSEYCLFSGCHAKAIITKRFNTPKPRIHMLSLCRLLTGDNSRAQFLGEYVADNGFEYPETSNRFLATLFKLSGVFGKLCPINLWSMYYQVVKAKELAPTIKWRMEPTYWKVVDGYIYDTVLHDGESIYFYGNHLPITQKFRMELLCFLCEVSSYKILHLDGHIETIEIMPKMGAFRMLHMIEPIKKMMQMDEEGLDAFLFS
nr:DNA polymerase III subunit epsilon [Kaumoebavirus]